MSALLPAANTLATRRPSSWPSACTAIPYDPDWVTMLTPPPPRGVAGRDRGVQRQVGVLHPEAVGPDQPHAARPGRGHRLGLQRRALAAGLREAGAEHDHRGDALGGGGPDNARYGGGGRGQHGQVHVAWDVTQGGVGHLATDALRRADRHDLAGEAVQVVPQQPADRAGPVGRPDQGDPARREHGGQAVTAVQHARPCPSACPAPRGSACAVLAVTRIERAGQFFR